MKRLSDLLALFKGIVNPVTQGNNRLMIYDIALQALGTDASPNDVAPDEYGCAETVYDIIAKVPGGAGIAFTVSTNLLYNELEKSALYTRIDQPLQGDIIISPTGYGNGTLPNGHTGIIGEVDTTNGTSTLIMSNDSATGLFKQNYTLATWTARYKDIGGYPIFFYRRV